MREQMIMVFHSEKKNSVRYSAPEGTTEPAMTTIYIMKTALTRPFPRSITITLEGGQ